jgi:hypothetical protein
MRHAFSMATLAKDGILDATIDKTYYQIKKPRADVQADKVES